MKRNIYAALLIGTILIIGVLYIEGVLGKFPSQTEQKIQMQITSDALTGSENTSANDSESAHKQIELKSTTDHEIYLKT
ncbi:MAG TPA: hypothetical protein VJG83_06150 [archaeon]|nr:hypothetical protein [archaeon]